jgi:hypothetical protein
MRKLIGFCNLSKNIVGENPKKRMMQWIIGGAIGFIIGLLITFLLDLF